MRMESEPVTSAAGPARHRGLRNRLALSSGTQWAVKCRRYRTCRWGVAAVRRILDAIGYRQRQALPESQARSLATFVGILQKFFFSDTLVGHLELLGQPGRGRFARGMSACRLSGSYARRRDWGRREHRAPLDAGESGFCHCRHLAAIHRLRQIVS